MEAPDDIKRAESGALLDELRQQVRRAEAASEGYQRELLNLKSQFDEAAAKHTKAGDAINEKGERIESLEKEYNKAEDRHKTLESQYATERTNFEQDRNAYAAKEEDLLSTIQRLKGALAMKESRSKGEAGDGLSRTGELYYHFTTFAY